MTDKVIPDIHWNLIESSVVVMELKVVEEREDKAIRQIKDKGYHRKYTDRTCYIEGLEFNKTIKELYSTWEKVTTV